jgi:Protein of unknown function (DUF3460)
MVILSKIGRMSFNFLSLFRRPHYQSDATDFILQLKAARPDLEARQRAGRALLWDKNVDRAAWSDYRAGEVEQKPYVYQTDSQ